MASKKDSAYSLHSCGGAHGGDVGCDPTATQHALKGNRANGGAWPPQGAGSAKAGAFSCAGAVVAQRALLASTRRRVGGGRRTAVNGPQSMVPSRLSKVSAAEDVAG